MLDVHQLRAHGANALSERHVVVEQQPSPGAVVPRWSTIELRAVSVDTLRMLPIVGVPARNALALAHLLGAHVELYGSDRVRSYQWKVQNGRRCLVLICN
jgi:hypothetical protein